MHKNCFLKVKTEKRLLQQDWGQGFILLLPQVAALPVADADSNGVEPALGFVIKNYQTTYSISCPMQAVGHAVKLWFAVCLMACTCNPEKEQGLFMHGQMELPNTSLQVSCLG